MIFSIAQIRGSRSTNITESSNLYYYLFSPTVISDNIFLTASNLDSVLDRSKWNNNFYYRRTNPAPIISIEKKEKRKEKKFNFEIPPLFRAQIIAIRATSLFTFLRGE